MMKGRTQGRGTPLLRSIRTKLLIMLAVLSLPLLVLSLYQLNNYRRSLNDQAVTIAQIKTQAASGALASWLEDHPTFAAQPEAFSNAEAQNLYAYLQQNVAPGTDAVVLVFNARGSAVQNPSAGEPTTTMSNLSTDAQRIKWSDGVARLTSIRRVEPLGWSVVVGVPAAENTSAGQAIIALAATWAVTLLASILIGFWAVGRFTKPLRKLAVSASSLG